jgi:hypothetical protein
VQLASIMRACVGKRRMPVLRNRVITGIAF